MSVTWGELSLSAAAAALILFSSANMAEAADLFPDETPEQIEEVTQVEFGTGWYIRADIGAGTSFGSDGGDSIYWDDADKFVIPKSLSLGVGTKISNSLRMDFTLERINALAKNRDGGNCGSAINSGDCNYSSHAEADATGIMANAYFDLSIWNGFTPYIGGGIGVANLEWTEFRVVGVDSANAAVSAPVVTTESRLAPMANIQAGLAFDVSDNMAIDFGYRLTGVYGDEFRDAAAISGQKASHETGTLFEHEIRVGVRYQIW